MPYYQEDGKTPNTYNRDTWNKVHADLSMELGVEKLGDLFWSYQVPNYPATWHKHTMDAVCKNWLLKLIPAGADPDRFMKERISLIELALRIHANQTMMLREQKFGQDLAYAKQKDAQLAATPFTRGRVRYDHEGGVRSVYERELKAWEASLAELNERLKRAGVGLTYKAGFFHFTTDALTEQEIVVPFWDLVKDPMWKNVEIDMSEAIDLRDTDGRDAAWYAAKALESVIKIISDSKGWTTGKEKGAVNFIENIGSKANGYFIDTWESDMLKDFFGKVRNPFGHGAGNAEMPELTDEQTDWAIETCMSWSKSLIERL